MTCFNHPSVGEYETYCPACAAGSPPDLGVSVAEETTTVERIS
jgi:hypothetical protein